jgi:hypothetical protein
VALQRLRPTSSFCSDVLQNDFDGGPDLALLAPAPSVLMLATPRCRPGLVEHFPFNAVVAGSSPARLTIIFNKLQMQIGEVRE